MARLGADVDRLDALGRDLATAGDRLGAIASTLTSAIAGVAWLGADADAFRVAWRSRYAPTLRDVGEALVDRGSRVREQADQQRRASAVDAAPAGDANANGWPDWLEQSPLGALLPPGPKYLHAGPDSPWTQQGQGYDAGRDEILTTYYDQDDTIDGAPDIPGVLLSIQDRATGAEATAVHLVGADGTGGPLHGGGVATDGELVYVVGGGSVWVYRRVDIDAAGAGGPVRPVEVVAVPASSFATINDGRLYVGSYENGEEGELYSYAVGPGGSLADVRYEGTTPHNSQGVAVHGGGFLFTQSHGPDDPSTLLFQPVGSDEATEIGDLSPLSQGLNVIGDHLYVTSEASAYQFDVPDAPVAIDVFDLGDFGLEP